MNQRQIELIAEYLERNFSGEELEALRHRPFDREMRVLLASKDMEFFARYYLPHHFDIPSGDFHGDIFEDLRWLMETAGRTHLLEEVFRGGGKTTIITLALPLWCIVFVLRRFIVIISATQGQSKEQLATIKDELEFNEAIIEDFGHLVGTRWTEDDIETANKVKVIALGSNQKIRGRKFRQWRPDLFILDDIEDDEGVRSETRRKQLRDWLFGAVLKAGWRDTKAVAIGNPLHWDCLLKHLERNPRWRLRRTNGVYEFAEDETLWEEWRGIVTNLADSERWERGEEFYQAHRQAMMEGVEVAWAEMYPYYELMVTRVSEGEAAFQREIMNNPISPEEKPLGNYGTFRMIWDWQGQGKEHFLVPWDGSAPSGVPAVPLSECILFAATDPSMGKNMRSHYSAIVIVARAPTNYLFVLVADIQRRPPAKIIDDQIGLFRRHPTILRWVIEANNMQLFFGSVSGQEALKELQVGLPLVEDDRHNASKEARILNLQPDLSNRYVLLEDFGQKLLKEQLTNWPDGYDDGPDALEMAVHLAKAWELPTPASVTAVSPYQFGGDEFYAPGESQERDPYALHDQLAEMSAAMARQRREIEQAKKEGREPRQVDDTWGFPIMF